MIYFYQLLFLIVTYLISSIPFGLVVGKLFGGKDVRNFGSNNIGATNVARVLGKKLGLITLFLDGIKGVIMVILGRYFFVESQSSTVFLSLIAAVAVFGHIFPIYLKFKGGKGVATTLAVLLAINPFIGLSACIAWLAIFLFTKTSAIASISSVIIAVGFSLYSGSPNNQIWLTIFLATLVVIRHKENINRILKGQEPKFKKSK